MFETLVRNLKKYQVPIAIIFAILVCVAFVYWYQEKSNFIFHSKKEIIEGVLVDPNFIGVKRVYPTSFNATDTERSVSSLIYESLFKVDKNENTIPILAESYSKNNLEYTIKIKSNIKFSNGEKLTTADVLATFDTMRTKFGANASQKLLQNSTYKAIDELNFSIKLNEITPTFFEDLDFGIMPASQLSGLTNQFIGLEISKDPIGTGPFKKFSENATEFKLVKNFNFRNAEKVRFENYIFKFFDSQLTLESQLLASQVTFTKNLRTNLLESIKEDYLKDPNSKLIDNESLAIPTRYFGLYFNLKDKSLYNNEESNILPIFLDENVRKAINLAIDKQAIARIVSPKSEIMQSVYSSLNWVNTNNSASYFFDNTKSNELLVASGWNLNSEGIRVKNNQTLSFKITYLENPIRNNLVSLIVRQLAQIGIKAIPDPIQDGAIFNDSIVKTKQFEVLFLGIETYIDPDRARLWAESQISVDGLNISSYKSSQKVQDPITGNEISKVDDLLARARNTDDKSVRARLYLEFQKIISDEVPVIFLYQPNFNLIQNKNLQIDITNATLPEEIYKNIDSWNLN